MFWIRCSNKDYINTPIGLNFKFNGGLTASYGYAFKQKFETKGGNFKTTADYKSVENGVPVNLNGLENLPNHGLTTFDEFKGDANLKQHLFGIGCEAGFGYCITHNLDLNLGVYRYNSALFKQELKKVASKYRVVMWFDS